MKDLMEQKDKLGRPVVVVTDVANRPGCIRAERCGRLAMVLSRCDRRECGSPESCVPTRG